MDVSTLLSRAQSGLNKQTKYQSPGLTPPLNANSWPAQGARIDCSGFAAWCLRISRVVDHPKYRIINGGWFETTGIHADAAASWGIFEGISKPEPGAFLVYPDHGSRDGHIGIVTEVNGASGIQGVTRIVHCSFSGWNNHGDAIRETDAGIWLDKSDSLIAWYTGVI